MLSEANRQDEQQGLRSTLSSYLDSVTKLLGAIAGFSAIAYTLGFAITSTYLLQFGFFEFEIIKARYVASGLVFIVLNCAVLAEPVYDLTRLLRLGSANDKISVSKFVKNSVVSLFWVAFVVFVFSTFVSLFLGVAPANPLSNVPLTQSTVLAAFDRALFLFWRLLAWSVILFIGAKATSWYLVKICVAPHRHDERRGPALQPSFITFPLLFGLPWLVFTVVYYSVTVYPAIPPSFGGGAPVEARLLVNTKDADYFDSLGILDSASKQGEAIATEPIFLVHRTEKQYLILVDRPTHVLEAMALDEKLVRALIYQ